MDLLQSLPPGAFVPVHTLGRAGNRPGGRFLGTSKHAVPPFAVAITLAALLAGMVACVPDQSTAGGGHGDGDSLFPRLPRVTGHIDRVDVDSGNPRNFRALYLTDADGRGWIFHSEGWVGVSTGHLKDHQIHGTPVTVWYEERPGEIQLARFVAD